MNPDELLLRDIHLPDPLSWWPPAIGWWLVAGGLLALCLTSAWWWRRRAALRRAPATLARVDLAHVRAAWLEHGDATRLIGELSVWLRRAGMSLTTRAQAAGLTGDAWGRFLDDVAGESVFDPEPGAWWVETPYRMNTAAAVTAPDAERILAACDRWLAAASRRQHGARA